MPFKPLVMVGIENLFNIFLYRSPASRMAHLRLPGKVLRVEVEGFSTSLILVLNERQVDVLDEWAGNADCTVTAYASALPKLRDRQQLTALIRSDELKAQGDIQVVQNFVVLVDLVEFDPAELSAPYTGDIAVGGISKAARGGVKSLYHGIKRRQRYMTEAVIEEWRMAPGPLEVAWFAEETATIERAVGTLTKRLEKLEAKWHQVKYGVYISSFAFFQTTDLMN